MLASVSRSANEVSSPEHARLARALRQNLAVYARSADMIAIGAYKQGGDAQIDRAVALKPVLDRFLRLSIDDHHPWSETLDHLRKILPDHEDIP